MSFFIERSISLRKCLKMAKQQDFNLLWNRLRSRVRSETLRLATRLTEGRRVRMKTFPSAAIVQNGFLLIFIDEV